MFTMKVTGVEKLQAKFEKIKFDMAEMYAAALLAGAGPVINTTKQTVKVVSGNLMRSYHIGTSKRDITQKQPDSDGTEPREMPVLAGSVALVADTLRRGRRAEVMVGTDVVYAPVQEFLHKPHLRPALESNRGEVNAEVKRAIKMMIKRAAA